MSSGVFFLCLSPPLHDILLYSKIRQRRAEKNKEAMSPYRLRALGVGMNPPLAFGASQNIFRISPYVAPCHQGVPDGKSVKSVYSVFRKNDLWRRMSLRTRAVLSLHAEPQRSGRRVPLGTSSIDTIPPPPPLFPSKAILWPCGQHVMDERDGWRYSIILIEL